METFLRNFEIPIETQWIKFVTDAEKDINAVELVEPQLMTLVFNLIGSLPVKKFIKLDVNYLSLLVFQAQESLKIENCSYPIWKS